MKRHCCRLVIISSVFRIIIAIHAYLHVKHTECGESQKHVAVDAKSRQRNHILIGWCLISYGVVPVPYAELKFLVNGCWKNLHASAILTGNWILIEIHAILYILHACTQVCFCPGDMKMSSDTEWAGFAEIIVPYEMVGYIMAQEIWRSLVPEESLSRDSYCVFTESEACFNITVDVEITCGIPHKTEFGIGGIAQQRTFHFFKSATYP